ncbi:hypothetical protein D3C76_1532970 [compost metagenome]
MMRLNTFTAKGIMKTHIELVKDKSFIRIYVGISPPLKNNVKTKKNIRNRRARNSCLDSVYAAGIVRSRLNSVPKIV